MSFIQVFRKPNGQPFAYQSGAPSLAEAAEFGAALAERNPELWGEFLYARSVHQAFIQPDEYYRLQPSQLQMRYRKESEEVNAPFDYLSYAGPYRQDLAFPLQWKDPTSGGTVTLVVYFNAGKAFKFWDLCKNYLAKFVLKDGQPVLQFFHPVVYRLIGEIPLQRKS
jgi:hypothetical protein